VLGSCPLQPSPPSINMHLTTMGGALTQATSTTIMKNAMQRPLCVIAQLFGYHSGSVVLFMIIWPFLTLNLGSAVFLQTPGLTMPRQRMRPRRGSPWHPRRPRTSSSPSGSSTPASDRLAVIDTILTPTWRHPSFRFSSPPPAPGETSANSPSGKPVHGRPRSKIKMPLPNLPRESSTILHDLVFELRAGVNDLQFRVQQMEGRLSILLQLLANPPVTTPEDSSDEPLTASDHASSHQQVATEGSPQSDGKACDSAPMNALERKQTLVSKKELTKDSFQW
jgi:hypothetical protein